MGTLDPVYPIALADFRERVRRNGHVSILAERGGSGRRAPEREQDVVLEVLDRAHPAEPLAEHVVETVRVA